VRTQRGLRLVQGRDVLSELLAKPGATGGFFDVLAACATTFAPPREGAQLALLGFAAGGIVAPLRALGFTGTIEAVDLSRDSEPLFRKLAKRWAGDVRVTRDEASAWLARRSQRYEMVIEDLTVPGPGVAVKPAVSLHVLPALVKRRLAPGGVVAVNALPVPGTTWPELLDRLARPHRAALVVHFDEYENRVLLAGDRLPPAGDASRRLRAALEGIGSRQVDRLRIRTWKGRRA
jgi:hypothetical protein